MKGSSYCKLYIRDVRLMQLHKFKSVRSEIREENVKNIGTETRKETARIAHLQRDMYVACNMKMHVFLTVLKIITKKVREWSYLHKIFSSYSFMNKLYTE